MEFDKSQTESSMEGSLEMSPSNEKKGDEIAISAKDIILKPFFPQFEFAKERQTYVDPSMPDIENSKSQCIFFIL